MKQMMPCLASVIVALWCLTGIANAAVGDDVARIAGIYIDGKPTLGRTNQVEVCESGQPKWEGAKWGQFLGAGDSVRTKAGAKAVIRYGWGLADVVAGHADRPSNLEIQQEGFFARVGRFLINHWGHGAFRVTTHAKKYSLKGTHVYVIVDDSGLARADVVTGELTCTSLEVHPKGLGSLVKWTPTFISRRGRDTITWPRYHTSLADATASLDRARAELDEDPSSASAHAMLGRALFDVGQHREAEAHFRQAVSLSPSTADYHLDLGKSLSQSGKARAALEQFEMAVQLAPDDSEAERLLAVEYTLREDYDSARRHYEAAVQLDDNNARAWANWGAALLNTGDVESSITKLRAAIKRDDTLVQGYYNLGRALRMRNGDGDVDGAIRAYRKAIELDPNFSSPHTNLANIRYESGDYQEAVAEAKQAIALEPTAFLPHMSLGLAYESLGRSDEAIMAYRNVLLLAPKSDAARRDAAEWIKQLDRSDHGTKQASGATDGAGSPAHIIHAGGRR